MLELEDSLIGLSDSELVRQLYDLVTADVDDQEAKSDALCWHLGELLERIAPDLEWADREQRVRAAYAAGDPLLEREIEDQRRNTRARAGARLIRRALADA